MPFEQLFALARGAPILIEHADLRLGLLRADCVNKRAAAGPARNSPALHPTPADSAGGVGHLGATGTVPAFFQRHNPSNQAAQILAAPYLAHHRDLPASPLAK